MEKDSATPAAAGAEAGAGQPLGPIATKLDTATRLKAQGNDLFKQQQYKKAIVKYATVLAYVKGLPGKLRT
jgi:hypothetical protein